MRYLFIYLLLFSMLRLIMFENKVKRKQKFISSDGKSFRIGCCTFVSLVKQVKYYTNDNL